MSLLFAIFNKTKPHPVLKSEKLPYEMEFSSHITHEKGFFSKMIFLSRINYLFSIIP